MFFYVFNLQINVFNIYDRKVVFPSPARYGVQEFRYYTRSRNNRSAAESGSTTLSVISGFTRLDAFLCRSTECGYRANN